MQYIRDLKEGSQVNSIYLVRKRTELTAKNGRPYISLMLADKTGSMDAKIWDPNSVGIEDFAENDYIDVVGEVTVYQKKYQMNVKRARKCREGEYNPSEFIPVSKKDTKQMWDEMIRLANKVKEPHLRQLIIKFFVEDKEFIRSFKTSSAAKTVHHAYMGGLLEHTLGVMKLCDTFADNYPFLNRDLLLTAAMFHDIGKTRELSKFPQNDYTDEGQLIGHIIIGVEMIDQKIPEIEGFPPVLASELRHCILAHHGELEFGSPKKPALAEAAALNFADNADAKLEIFREMFEKATDNSWLGWQQLLDSNIRKTEI